MSETENQNHDFDQAVSHAATGDYKYAAGHLFHHPEDYEGLYNRLVQAYSGAEETPKLIAKQIDEELERLKQNNHQE